MHALLENYLNGNIAYVKDPLKVDGDYTFAQFYEFYTQEIAPTPTDLMLLVNRLS